MKLKMNMLLIGAAIAAPAIAQTEPAAAPASETPATAASTTTEAPAAPAAVQTTPAAPADAVQAVPAPATEPATAQVSASLQANGLTAPPDGKGQIVFFRKGGFVGSAISCAVHENGQKVSSLPPGRYFVHVADPGPHAYSVKSEATDTLRMEVESGETYYAQCGITMGILAGRPNLSPATPEGFTTLRDKLKLVEPK